MASSEQDQQRWIERLEAIRKEIKSKSTADKSYIPSRDKDKKVQQIQGNVEVRFKTLSLWSFYWISVVDESIFYFKNAQANQPYK